MGQISFLPKNLLQILANTNDVGRVEWYQAILPHEVEIFKNKTPEELFHYMFNMTHLYKYSGSMVTSDYLLKLRPEVKITEEYKKLVFLSANACIFCGLLNLNPKKEIATLYHFLKEIKEVYSSFYEDNHDYYGELYLEINNEDKILLNGLVFAGYNKENAKQKEFLDKQIDILRNKIKSDTVLLAWFLFNHKLVVKNKNTKIVLSTSSFFDENENPLLIRYALDIKKDEEIKKEEKLKREREKLLLIDDLHSNKNMYTTNYVHNFNEMNIVK